MKTAQYVGAKMALNTNGWAGLVENALMVSLAAALTYVTQHVGKEDFGQYTPAVVAVATLVLSYLQKVINNPVTPQPAPVVPPAPQPSDTTTGEKDFPLG